MAGRGGRGLALLEALSQRAGESDPTLQPPTVSSSPPGSSLKSAVQSIVAGRGRVKPSEFLAAASISPQSTATTPSVGGRGRAALLLSLAQQSQEDKPKSLSESVDKLSLGSSSKSSSLPPPVTRHGKAGNPIRATANYIRLACDPEKGVFEYEVKFNPEVDSKSFRFKMLNSKLSELGGVKDFDGRALFLPIRLPDQTFQVTHPGDDSLVQMRIIYKKQKHMADNIYFFNILFKRIFRDLEMVQLGRDYYNSKAGTEVPQYRLEVWPGYVTAVDEYEDGIMLSIDASHRILRTITCLDVIKDAIHKSSQSYREVAMKQLIGASVLTRYNNKMYTVDDVLWDENPESTFETKGSKISYFEYYERHYGLKIKDARQPLLLNRFKKKIPGRETETLLICLIPELSYMTGLTDEMRNDFRLMKDIASYTRITPDQRKRALMKFINSVNGSEKASKHLSDWGLRLCNDTIDIEARVFPDEKICFGGNGRNDIVCKEASWNSAACRNVLDAVNIQNWVIVYCGKNERQARDFVACLQRNAPQMGIDVAQPKVVCLRDDSVNAYVNSIRDNVNEDVQIIVTICPTSRDDRYAAIKKVTCSEMPVASQVIIAKTISNVDKMRPIVQKIALQMNCKLGGSLWYLKVPLDNLMICGIDSYHGGTGSKAPSVGAFVASLNATYSRWYSKVCFQERGQELIDGLKICFISALKKYHEVNGKFPERIIIYRDGVGDGQLKVCRDYEVPQLESCYPHVGPNYNPKLSLVIVQKRINTRIFDVSRKREENPPPGTVVDHTITRRNWYDFFLVSQLVRQGTVSPTHYVVVEDENDLPVDHMQKLTYKMTHMYYNWPGTVRVPAPCQYAHKLAYLVGQNIQRVPSDKLSDKLYFL